MSNVTEEQQFEELKEWWQENGKFVVIVFVVTLLAVFGWKYWQNYKLEQLHAVATNYSKTMIVSHSSNNTQAIENFVNENKDSNYAIFALMNKAKVEVEQQNFLQAEKSLKQALEITKDDNLKSIILLRIANLQYQQRSFKPAQATLEQVTLETYQVEKNILLGDVLLARESKVGAKKAYEDALAKVDPNSNEFQIIQLKLNNLL